MVYGNGSGDLQSLLMLAECGIQWHVFWSPSDIPEVINMGDMHPYTVFQGGRDTRNSIIFLHALLVFRHKAHQLENFAEYLTCVSRR